MRTKPKKKRSKLEWKKDKSGVIYAMAKKDTYSIRFIPEKMLGIHATCVLYRNGQPLHEANTLNIPTRFFHSDVEWEKKLLESKKERIRAKEGMKALAQEYANGKKWVRPILASETKEYRTWMEKALRRCRRNIAPDQKTYDPRYPLGKEWHDKLIRGMQADKEMFEHWETLDGEKSPIVAKAKPSKAKEPAAPILKKKRVPVRFIDEHRIHKKKTKPVLKPKKKAKVRK